MMYCDEENLIKSVSVNYPYCDKLMQSVEKHTVMQSLEKWLFKNGSG